MLNVEDNFQFASVIFKCNSILEFLKYICIRGLLVSFSCFDDITQLNFDIEFDSSSNLNPTFHIGVDILNFLFHYNFFMFLDI